VAKERLLAALEALRNGTPGPRRILIVGPSGSGKSALVRWLATRGLPVFAVPGSQFVEVFVGNGAARVRKLFKVAAEKQPCVVAIDDFDAFATRRVIPDTKGLVDERGATMLEFAGALDGLRQLPPRVLVIATTSRADVLDEAVVRPGRFDLRLELQLDRESSAQELRA
jgi:cell division protease FtsH